jgi:hypothetical protein
MVKYSLCLIVRSDSEALLHDSEYLYITVSTGLRDSDALVVRDSEAMFVPDSEYRFGMIVSAVCA